MSLKKYFQWKFHEWNKGTKRLLTNSRYYSYFSLMLGAYFMGIKKSILWGIILWIFSIIFWIYFDYNRGEWKHWERKKQGRIYPSEVKRNGKKAHNY